MKRNTFIFLIISRSVFRRMRNISDETSAENRKIYFIVCNFCRKSCRLWDNVEKYRGTRQATQDNMTCPLRAGFLRLQTHTHNIKYLLFVHCNNGCTNAPQCYVIRTLPVLYPFLFFLFIIHSFSSLSDVKAKAPSKSSSPHSAI